MLSKCCYSNQRGIIYFHQHHMPSSTRNLEWGWEKFLFFPPLCPFGTFLSIGYIVAIHLADICALWWITLAKTDFVLRRNSTLRLYGKSNITCTLCNSAFLEVSAYRRWPTKYQLCAGNFENDVFRFIEFLGSRQL